MMMPSRRTRPLMWTPSLPHRAGVRRAARLRQRYLTAALYQDIPYYDTTMTAGAVISGLNTDCAAVQAATSERIGHTINNLTQFFLGLVVGFVRGWKLSLVMVAVFPVMAVAGAIVAKVATAGDAQNSKAYAAANNSAAQAIANVRTVAAFQAEQPLLARYTELLAYPKRVSVRMSVLTGIANGSINAAVFVACAPNPHSTSSPPCRNSRRCRVRPRRCDPVSCGGGYGRSDVSRLQPRRLPLRLSRWQHVLW